MIIPSSTLVKDRPRFKGAYLKALGDEDWMFNKDDKTHVPVGGPV